MIRTVTRKRTIMRLRHIVRRIDELRPEMRELERTTGEAEWGAAAEVLMAVAMQMDCAANNLKPE